MPIDKGKLKTILDVYKQHFKTNEPDVGIWWENESDKWKAVNIFHKNWNVDTDDFVTMFDKAMPKGFNDTNFKLDISSFDRPWKGLTYLIEKGRAKEIQAQFKNLFNENDEIDKRIDDFRENVNAMLDEERSRDPEKNTSGFNQNLRVISMYLILRYPEKYYAYKRDLYQYKVTEMVDGVEKESKVIVPLNQLVQYLDAGPDIKSNGNGKTYLDAAVFYDKLCKGISKDEQLIQMVNNAIKKKNESDPGTYYEDPKHHMLVQDIGYFYGTHDKLFKNHPIQTPPPGGPHIQEHHGPVIEVDSYDENHFVHDVFMDKKQLKAILAVLKHKRNIILQGPPGVGKTFAAKRLAYVMMGKKDDSHIRQIQFHQSYTYENFIRGYQPAEDGKFKLEDGIFLDLCKDAKEKPKEKYFLIIDEINRGNLSKIFGELMMCIESKYRNTKVTLAYRRKGEKPFFVPDNVYLIGTMNTADRSLAIIDYALRRRFAFITMEPQLANDRFIENVKTGWPEGKDPQPLLNLIDAVKKLNEGKILTDESLGKGFCIGHSYFVKDDDEKKDMDPEALANEIVDFEIAPLLDEYWFDEKGKAEAEVKTLKKGIKGTSSEESGQEQTVPAGETVTGDSND